LLRCGRTATQRLALDLGQQAITRNADRNNAQGVRLTIGYFTRTCPRCNGHVEIILQEPERNTRLQAFNGHCKGCPYRLAWIVIRGNHTSRDRLPALRRHAQNTLKSLDLASPTAV